MLVRSFVATLVSGLGSEVFLSISNELESKELEIAMLLILPFYLLNIHTSFRNLY